MLAVAGALALPLPANAATFGISTPTGTLFPGTVTITGDKDASATVDVNGVCAVPTGSETWSCDLTLPDGNQTVTATQTAADTTVTTLTVPIRVLSAPVITTTGLSAGTIAGTGFPGAGIEISGDLGRSCGVVPANGAWTCVLGVGTGTYNLAATQTWGNVPSERGGTSATVALHVDADPPAAPTFQTPAAGGRVTSQPTLFSGTGENGGRVEVLVDNSRVCQSPVISGAWSCSATLADGQRSIHGIQVDAAGNATRGTSFTITVGAAPVSPAPAPAAPAPQSPAQQQPSAPTVPMTPAPSAPFLPPPVGGLSGLAPFETWELPTDYGAAIPSVNTTSGTSWLLGLVLGLGFALLVALPLRLLVTTVRRKRGYEPRPPADGEPLLSPRLNAAIFLAAAVLLAALAGGVQAEARYLRLAIAIGVALAVLNGVAVLAAKIAGRALGVEVGIRLAPLMLGIAAVTALVSRVGGIQPPIVVGIVLAARFTPGLPGRVRGIVALVQVSAVLTLGFVAWFAQSALGPVDGFGPSLVSEALSALTIAALGSAMVMLLPVHRMPGRLIWEHSRTAWAVITLVTATVAGVAIASSSGFPTPWVIGGALVFAAVSVGAWLWVHLIEPNLDTVGGGT